MGPFNKAIQKMDDIDNFHSVIYVLKLRLKDSIVDDKRQMFLGVMNAMYDSEDIREIENFILNSANFVKITTTINALYREQSNQIAKDKIDYNKIGKMFINQITNRAQPLTKAEIETSLTGAMRRLSKQGSDGNE